MMHLGPSGPFPVKKKHLSTFLTIQAHQQSDVDAESARQVGGVFQIAVSLSCSADQTQPAPRTQPTNPAQTHRTDSLARSHRINAKQWSIPHSASRDKKKRRPATADSNSGGGERGGREELVSVSLAAEASQWRRQRRRRQRRRQQP
jgi:hypothetical protein